LDDCGGAVVVDSLHRVSFEHPDTIRISAWRMPSANLPGFISPPSASRTPPWKLSVRPSSRLSPNRTFAPAL